MGAKSSVVPQKFPLPNPMTGGSNSNGSVTFPNGLILKWGLKTGMTGETTAVLFDTAFPNALFQVFAMAVDSSITECVHNVYSKSSTGFTIHHHAGVTDAQYFAIGR